MSLQKDQIDGLKRAMKLKPGEGYVDVPYREFEDAKRLRRRANYYLMHQQKSLSVRVISSSTLRLSMSQPRVSWGEKYDWHELQPGDVKQMICPHAQGPALRASASKYFTARGMRASVRQKPYGFDIEIRTGK